MNYNWSYACGWNCACVKAYSSCHRQWRRKHYRIGGGGGPKQWQGPLPAAKPTHSDLTYIWESILWAPTKVFWKHALLAIVIMLAITTAGYTTVGHNCTNTLYACYPQIMWSHFCCNHMPWCLILAEHWLVTSLIGSERETIRMLMKTAWYIQTIWGVSSDSHCHKWG